MRLEPAALLRSCVVVESTSAILEVRVDSLAVLLGLVVVVLELRVDADDGQAHGPNAREQSTVRLGVDGHVTVTTLWLEVAELLGQHVCLALRIVDDRRRAHQLHRGVVARGYAGLLWRSGHRAPVGRDEGVVTEHRETHLGRGLKMRPHRVGSRKVDEDLVVPQ